ncbi:hypothetical protein ABT150_23085 [Streptomyces mirabilis]
MNEQTTAETVQPALFPLSAVQTSGCATPDTDEAEAVEVDDAGAEAA